MNEETISMQNIMTAIEQSLEKANEALESQYLNHISSYFNEDGRPKTKTIILQNEYEAENKVDVPLISLTRPSKLNIKNVNISFSAYVVGVDKNNNLLIDFKKSSKTKQCEKINIDITFDSKQQQGAVNVTPMKV